MEVSTAVPATETTGIPVKIRASSTRGHMASPWRHFFRAPPLPTVLYEAPTPRPTWKLSQQIRAPFGRQMQLTTSSQVRYFSSVLLFLLCPLPFLYSLNVIN